MHSALASWLSHNAAFPLLLDRAIGGNLQAVETEVPGKRKKSHASQARRARQVLWSGEIGMAIGHHQFAGLFGGVVGRHSGLTLRMSSFLLPLHQVLESYSRQAEWLKEEAPMPSETCRFAHQPASPSGLCKRMPNSGQSQAAAPSRSSWPLMVASWSMAAWPRASHFVLIAPTDSSEHRKGCGRRPEQPGQSGSQSGCSGPAQSCRPSSIGQRRRVCASVCVFPSHRQLAGTADRNISCVSACAPRRRCPGNLGRTVSGPPNM